MLAFCVNNKQVDFFEKLKEKTNLKIKIIRSFKLFKFNINAFSIWKKIYLNELILLRIKDYQQKYSLPIPKYLLFIFFKINAIFCVMRYYQVIKQSKKLLVWNGFMFRQAIAIEIAKLHKIDIIYFETGFLPHRFVMDIKGVNFYNSVPREKSFFLNYKNNKVLPTSLIARQPKNKSKFFVSTKESLPVNYIFIPFQVEHDTQILLFSSWIHSMEELFFLIKQVAEELGLNFVFKEHPSSKKEYRKLHKITQNHQYLSFKNTYETQELIEKANAIITINSSIGIESLLFHQKVITLGDAFFNIEGVVKHSNNKEELITTLKHLDKYELNQHLIQNFLKYLYWDYLIDNQLKDSTVNRLRSLL